MAKNRFNQPAALRFGTAIKAVLIGLFLILSGAGYVWQQEQIGKLGEQQRKLEGVLRQLKLENKLRMQQLEELRLAGNLERKAREMKLGLLPVQPNQVVRLAEPVPPAPLPARPPGEYAASNNGAKVQ